MKFAQSTHPDLPAQGRIFLLGFFVCGGINLFGFEKEWQRKRRMISSILNKLDFDANDLIVDQNNQYNKRLSEDFTLGFVKYLLESTKTWKEGYQLIKQYVLD